MHAFKRLWCPRRNLYPGFGCSPQPHRQSDISPSMRIEQARRRAHSLPTARPVSARAAAQSRRAPSRAHADRHAVTRPDCGAAARRLPHQARLIAQRGPALPDSPDSSSPAAGRVRHGVTLKYWFPRIAVDYLDVFRSIVQEFDRLPRCWRRGRRRQARPDVFTSGIGEAAGDALPLAPEAGTRPVGFVPLALGFFAAVAHKGKTMTAFRTGEFGMGGARHGGYLQQCQTEASPMAST